MRKNKFITIAVIPAIIASFFAISWAKPNGETGSFKNNKSANIEENERYLISNDDIIEIRERMFATHVRDVYLNPGDYLGKTIKLEGIFKKEQWGEPGKIYYFVVRYGPGGCCGFDANVGFEVAWAKNRARPYPNAESWVEAIGVLKTHDQYLYLDLSSLNVLSRRGSETVRQ